MFFIGLFLFDRLGLITAFDLDILKLKAFLTAVEVSECQEQRKAVQTQFLNNSL